MRRLFIFFTVVSFVTCFSSCSEYQSDLIQEKEVTVALKLSGDFSVDVTQDPITKASTNDAYGINVYYDREGDGATNDVYAYGLFDNVAAMSITLLSGHKYKFTCGLVKNAKTMLYYGQAFGNTYPGYAYPFQTNTNGSTPIGNQFHIGTGKYLSGIGNGAVHLKNNSIPSSSNATQYASINRFYGETDQYEPVPNGTVDIYLKRVIFGARFIVNGIQEGSLSVSCGDFYNQTYTQDDLGTETIYTFANGPYSCWKYEEDHPDMVYSVSSIVSINYTSNRGTLWDLSNSQTVVFKRNVMTTVTINVSPDLSGSSFSFSEEPFGDNNDINIGINTDGLIDVIVNPT